VRRREFIGLAGGAAVCGHGVRAEPPILSCGSNINNAAARVRRVAALMDITRGPDGSSGITAFEQKLQQLGWVEGNNLQFDVCWTEGDHRRVRVCATQLVSSVPDVILASGPFALDALRQMTHTIPLVFVQIGEPVETGVVPSRHKPGGNITGSAAFEYSIAAKWAELLKQIAPQVTRVTVLQNTSIRTHAGYVRAIETAAPALGIEVVASESDMADATEIESVITAAAHRSNGLIVPASPAAAIHCNFIASQALMNRLPSIYPYREYVTSGGLLSYGNNVSASFQRAATQVDLILRGARVGDLPIQFANTFELCINLKTALALGLSVPPVLLARANEVIE
jgi:putative tryptophan/tyrosine transport system substrate-binding protein